jgi:hypothetical protein
VIPALFNPRMRSLPRGNILVLGSLLVAFLMSGFPYLKPNLWIALPVLFCILGTIDTVRCIQRRWTLYHGGVILCIYMDLMAISMVLFFLLYPYCPPIFPHA